MTRVRNDPYEQVALALALVAASVFLFAPLVLIYFSGAGAVELAPQRASEVTVGIAVIVRATARRLLTTAASNILRTTFATFSRAAARTFLRRFIRFFVRTVFGVLVRDIATTAAGERDKDTSVEPQTLRTQVLALTIGFFGLAASFAGVVWVLGPAAYDGVTANGQVSMVAASMLAAFPLLVYGAVTIIASRPCGVAIRINTAIDGLLLQGYFTGAGSFLPMTTDVEYDGKPRARMWLAIWVLVGLYVLHVVLGALAAAVDSYALGFASGVALIYCFVYSFPISPLEGYDIWRGSRWIWLLVWIPILLSFLVAVPEAVITIL